MSDTFTALLSVQDHDTTIDQLEHRRATLGVRAELEATRKALTDLGRRRDEVGAEHGGLAGRQGELEHQIEASGARRAQLEKQMMATTGSSPRELQAMDEEVRQLARHVHELEDRELELMELLEPIEAALAQLDARRSELVTEEARLVEAVAAAEAEIHATLEAERAARAAASAGVGAELLDRYERLRAKLGGTGAARLVGDSCGGCHLTLPAMEVDRIRKAPPDQVVTCDQCGRILVRS